MDIHPTDIQIRIVQLYIFHFSNLLYSYISVYKSVPIITFFPESEQSVS